MEIDDYKRIIRNFSFDKCKRGNQGFNRILIQLFGTLGVGKSAFINTCKYVWDDGEYKDWANAAPGYGAVTMDRTTHLLTENITLVDNRCAIYYINQEILAQLGNLLPLDRPVRWSRGLELIQKIVDAEKEIKTSDLIVPVFVHHAAISLCSYELDYLKECFDNVTKVTGIFPIVVLTNKNHKHEHSADIEKAFRSIGTERFYSLENYTPENHVKTRQTHESVIRFLNDVILDVEYRLDHSRDPEQERIDRKVFVVNYIHNEELENQKNYLEKTQRIKTLGK